MDLSNKVALVTGSTSGIGLGIARTLAAAPWCAAASASRCRAGMRGRKSRWTAKPREVTP